MPFCTKCGGQMADTANFCIHCGVAIGSDAASAPSVSLSVSDESRINQEWNDLAPADWDIKKHANERGMLEGLLEDGEHLECLVSGDFKPEGKLPHISLGVATDCRLIFLRQTKRANEVVELPYDTIESISFKMGWMGGGVKVTSRHKDGYQMDSIQPKERAKLFAETVQPHLTPMPERSFAATEPAPSMVVGAEPVPINETVPVAIEEPVSAATDTPIFVAVSKAGRFEQEWVSLAPVDWGNKKHANERVLLEELLEDDERLECLVSGDFTPDGGWSHNNLGVATDRRLVFLRKKKDSDEVVSLPYYTVDSISFNMGWMGGIIKVTPRRIGGYQMGNIQPKERAKLFAETVQSLIAAAPEEVSIPLSKEERIDQEWISLAPANWDIKKHADEREILPGLLADDELMECLVSGFFENTDFGGSNTNLGVVTDRRVVFLRKTRRSSEVVELPFDAISHISSNTDGSIKVSAQGKGRFAMWGIRPKEQAQEFVVAMQPRIAVAQEGKPTPVNKEDRIDQEWDALIPKGWGSFKNTFMLSGERKMLYRLLEDGEHLECLVGGKFGPDLGRSNIARDKSLHNGVGVATDRRVIFVDSGIASSEVAEMPYTSIEAISYSSGISLAGLKISARGSTSLQMEMIRSMDEAKVFADTVRKHLNAGQTAAPTVVQTASAMDELEKAAALYERGLLTQEEFETKKAQLLNG